MSLWFTPRVNNLQPLGAFDAQRREHLDISDPVAVADVVSTYTIRIDGRMIGEVRHRYGDGAWALIRAGLDLAATKGRLPAAHR